jgi:hypothetical protein
VPDPHVTINLKKYASQVNAEPLSCEDYTYMVIKAKAAGTTGDCELYASSSQSVADIVPGYCEPNGEWQYMIFDLSYCDGWLADGTPITVRLDWAIEYEGAVEDAYMTVGEIALFKTEEEAYAHAGEEIPTVPQKTEAPETDAPTTDAPTTEAETEAEQGGCKSAMASAALVAVIALGALTLGKKKD